MRKQRESFGYQEASLADHYSLFKCRPSPFLTFHNIVTFLILFLLFAGCGKKGPPLPPESLVPEMVREFKVEGREGGILLSWIVPDKNNDGTLLVDLAGFKVYKKSEVPGCKSCPSEFPLYLDIDIEAEEGIKVEGNRVFLRDKELIAGGSYRYKVVPYNRGRHFGTFSEVITVAWQDPPFPPSGLEGSASDRSVSLKWKAYSDDDLDFLGYRVYRSNSSGNYPRDPITALPVTGSGFTDIGLENNRQYYYVVRSVIKGGDTVIEGASSREVLFVPVDMVPPSLPEGVSVVPTGSGVAISWDMIMESDIAGYNIYRRVEGQPTAEKINALPVRSSHYLDRDAQKGKSYFYSVSSIDKSPQENESSLSGEIAVTIHE